MHGRTSSNSREKQEAEQAAQPQAAASAKADSVAEPTGAALSPSGILGLQRSFGNAAVSAMLAARSAAPPALARQGAGPVAAPAGPAAPPAPAAPAATHHTRAELDAMTLGEFNTFAEEQADWASEPGRPPATPAMDRDYIAQLRRLLEFAREDDGGTRPVLAGCGGMTVHDLLATRLTAKVRAELRRYSRAVARTAVTVELQAVTDVARARQYGEALEKLERTPGPGVSHTIFKQTEGADQLGELIDSGFLDDFIRYCRICHPLLEANTGAEITSYLELRDEAVDPISYHGRLPDVRNYHRFEKDALERLVRNIRHTAKDKPLRLILHSAFDHNGAFHRDPNLTTVITDSNNLVLMIEGAESLAAISGRLGPIARRYGQANKIEQVMLAGHGNAQIIQMAGTLDTGALDTGASPDEAERDDAVVSSGNTANTDAFMRELLKNMSTSPDARIVLNGCLTASNSVNAPLDADPDRAAAQVQAAIQAEPSLATFVGQAAAAQGRPDLQVRGANASFGQVGLLDSAGNLDIVPDPATAPDPLLTASKVDYIRGGNEPQGCLRAVLEVWAQDRLATPRTTAAIDAVRARLRQPNSTDWDQRVIRTLYGIVDANPDAAELIRQLGFAGGELGELIHESECRVDRLTSVPAAHANTIYGGLTTATAWSSIKRMPLVVYQRWMAIDNTKRAAFLATLGDASFDCSTAQRFVDMGVLGPHLAAMLPVAAAPTASRGQMILALLGAIDAGAVDPTCRDFLRAVVGTGPGFPAGAGIGALLGGLSDQTSIERNIGVRGPGVAEEVGPRRRHPTSTSTATASTTSTSTRSRAGAW
jgi:hypothetical protein